METQKCRALLRAIDTGSFSAAAEALGFTPSGISHMITSIENEVGFSILKRSRNGVTLTANGEELLPLLRALVKIDINIEQQSSEILGLARGHITIGAYSSIAAQWLPQILRDFQRDYPGISIQMMEGTHDELDGWMSDGYLDFCMYSYRSDIDFEWIPLSEDPMYAVVSPEHPFAFRSHIAPKECEGQPFIMPGRSMDADVSDIIKKFSLSLDIKYRTIENYSAISMIECGLGISIMNELITKGRISNVMLVPFDPPQHIDLGIAVPSLKQASPAAKKMVEYIRKHFE